MINVGEENATFSAICMHTQPFMKQIKRMLDDSYRALIGFTKYNQIIDETKVSSFLFVALLMELKLSLLSSPFKNPTKDFHNNNKKVWGYLVPLVDSSKVFKEAFKLTINTH